MCRLDAAPLAERCREPVWSGTDRNIWEAVWDGASWHGPMPRGMGPVGSPPAIARWQSEIDLYWQGGDHNLWGATSHTGAWSGPANHAMGPLG